MKKFFLYLLCVYCISSCMDNRDVHSTVPIPTPVVKAEEKLEQVDVWMSGNIDEYLNPGYAGRVVNTGEKKVMVYILFKKNLLADVKIKAYGDNELELGKAVAKISGKQNDEIYVDFVFNNRTPLYLAKYFSLEIN